MDLMTEEKSTKSSASCKAGKPGRKRKQFSVSVDLTFNSYIHSSLHVAHSQNEISSSTSDF